MSSTIKVQKFKLHVIALNSRVNYIFNKLRSSAQICCMHAHACKVIREKSRGEVSLIEQETIENVS